LDVTFKQGVVEQLVLNQLIWTPVSLTSCVIMSKLHIPWVPEFLHL
jgi:hypothetical protein